MSAVREAELLPDLEMLSAATEACSKAGDSEGALHFLDQAVGLGFSPDGRMFKEVRDARLNSVFRVYRGAE